MNTEEKNRIIAEFMGFENQMQLWRNPENRLCFLIGGDWVPVCNLKYHTSWDWLMPVIQKVATITEGSERYMLDLDINISYERAVDYIQWHNTQPTTKDK